MNPISKTYEEIRRMGTTYYNLCKKERHILTNVYLCIEYLYNDI